MNFGGDTTQLLTHDNTRTQEDEVKGQRSFHCLGRGNRNKTVISQGAC